ncbi:MAG: hypothetical protein IJC57_00210 [Clostridia bacterium]|nr:hypothetical protein [Clostridia bacterium]
MNVLENMQPKWSEIRYELMVMTKIKSTRCESKEIENNKKRATGNAMLEI